MTDTRKTLQKREHVYTVKFHEEELQRLKQMSDAEFRRPGDLIRWLLDQHWRDKEKNLSSSDEA